MNYEDLSDEELDQRLAKASKSKPLESLSDDELDARIAAATNQPPKQKEQPGLLSAGGAAQKALEAGGNAAAMGYLPQLQAMAEKPLFAAANFLTGNDVQADDYVTSRDKNVKRLAAQEEANPNSALAGTIGGSVVGALATPIPGLGAGGGLIKTGLKGAGGGAIQGALSNPGDIEGIVDPLQLEERKEGAKTGAKFGLLTSAGSKLASKGAGALARSGKAAEEIAGNAAVKASGGMLKDFRTLGSKGKIDKVGKYALDKGIVKAGDTFDDVAAKAESINKKAGEDLGSIYERAQEELAYLDPAKKAAADSMGFNPVLNKDEILSQVKKDLGDSASRRTALKKVSNYMDQLIEDYGDQTLSPKLTNEIKGELDEVINYARNPLTQKPGTEKGFSSARKYLNQKVQDHIGAIDEVLGKDSDTVAALKAANEEYGNSATLKNMARDKTYRESANRAFGLTDTIASGTGGVLGGGIAAASGDKSPLDVGVMGLLGAGAGALANKAGRSYGPAMIAALANKSAKGLSRISGPARKLENLDPVLMSRILTNTGLRNGK